MRYTKSVIGVAIGAAIVVSVPFFMGFTIKNQQQQWLSHINQQLPKSNDLNMSLTTLSYHQGWFNSTTQLALEVRKPLAQTQSQLDNAVYSTKIIIDSKIKHGPVFLDQNNQLKLGFAFSETNFNFNESSLLAFNNAAKALLENFREYNLFKFNGDIVSNAIAPAAKYTNSDAGVNIEFLGLQSDLTHKSNRNIFFGQFTFDGLNLQTPVYEQAHFGKMRINLPQPVDTSSLQNVQATLDELTIKGVSDFSTRLENFELKMDHKLNSDRLDRALTVGFSKLEVNNGVLRTFAPFTFNSAITNINYQGFLKLREIFSQQSIPAPNSGLGLRVIQLLPEIIDQTMQARVFNLATNLDGKEINAALEVEIPKISEATEQSLQNALINEGIAHFQLQLPQNVLESLLSDFVEYAHHDENIMLYASAFLPKYTKPLAPAAPQTQAQSVEEAKILLQQLIQSGALILNEQLYSFNLDYNKGDLTINSQPFISVMVKLQDGLNHAAEKEHTQPSALPAQKQQNRVQHPVVPLNTPEQQSTTQATTPEEDAGSTHEMDNSADEEELAQLMPEIVPEEMSESQEEAAE